MSPLSRPSLHRLVPALLAAAAIFPTAAAAAGNPVIRDCTDDGKLSKKYTQKQYSDALKNIPTDVDEYTDCRDVIRRAQLGSASTGNSSSGTSPGAATGTGGGGGSTGGGSTGGDGAGASAGTADEALQSASSAEKAAIDQARDAATSAPIQVGSQAFNPDDLKKSDLSSLSTVPTPLLIVLGLLALAALGGGGSVIMSRVRANRSSTAA